MSPKWFGSGKSNASPKAMTIQELEKLLTKRQSGNKDAILSKGGWSRHGYHVA